MTLARTFFFALLATCSCSSSSSSSSSSSGSSDAGADVDGGDDAPVCTPANNDPECPAHYHDVPCNASCPRMGLRCEYPGEGDLPCPSYALAQCGSPGVDAGTLAWSCNQ